MATTPWGAIDISDAHVHFFSHSFFAALAQQSATLPKDDPHTAIGAKLGWVMPPNDPAELGLAWTAELDRHGVSRAALIASVPGDEASVIAAAARFPDRFHGYFLVNPLAPDAVDRTRAALSHGMRGVCLFPAMQRYSIADPRVRPVIEVAAATPGAIVFVHSGLLTVGVRKKLGLPSPFDMRYSNPIDIHPVALDFPALPFVIPHFGAGYFRETLMLADLCPNVRLDTSSSNSWMKYEELDLRTVFRRALAVCGAERLLFGSDSSFFPRGWHAAILDHQAQALYELGVTETDARKIFGSNLEALLAV